MCSQLKEQTKNLKQLNTQLETLEDNKSTNEHQLARYKRQVVAKFFVTNQICMYSLITG